MGESIGSNERRELATQNAKHIGVELLSDYAEVTMNQLEVIYTEDKPGLYAIGVFEDRNSEKYFARFRLGQVNDELDVIRLIEDNEEFLCEAHRYDQLAPRLFGVYGSIGAFTTFVSGEDAELLRAYQLDLEQK